MPSSPYLRPAAQARSAFIMEQVLERSLLLAGHHLMQSFVLLSFTLQDLHETVNNSRASAPRCCQMCHYLLGHIRTRNTTVYLQSTRGCLANTLHWEQHSLLFGNSGAFGKYCLSFSQASLETTLRSFSDMHRPPAGTEPREGLCSPALSDVVQH